MGERLEGVRTSHRGCIGITGSGEKVLLSDPRPGFKLIQDALDFIPKRNARGRLVRVDNSERYEARLDEWEVRLLRESSSRDYFHFGKREFSCGLQNASIGVAYTRYQGEKMEKE